MRVLVALFLAAAVLCSVSSAEILTTANTLGQGKWGVLGSYLSNNDAGGAVDSTVIGGYVAYGLMDNLDAYLQLGSLSTPAGATGNAYGLNLKYNLVKEGADMPVSIAVGGGYKSMSIGGTDGSQIAVIGGVSKVLAPFAPYAGVAYKMLTAAGADAGTQLDLTIGTAIAWSEQGAVFAEYTSASWTLPGGAGNVSSSQIAAGVGYAL